MGEQKITNVLLGFKIQFAVDFSEISWREVKSHRDISQSKKSVSYEFEMLHPWFGRPIGVSLLCLRRSQKHLRGLLLRGCPRKRAVRSCLKHNERL
jgi:hypothetical protein